MPIKPLFSLKIIALCLFICFNSTHSFSQDVNTSSFSIFKSCENENKPVHCSSLKLDAFIAQTVKRVNETIPYYFEDSVSISFTVKKGGKRININHKSSLFSTEALRLCHLELLNLFPQISKTAYGTKITVDFIFKIPKEIKGYTNSEDMKNLPIVKNCATFNKQGQRACFSYLSLPINKWLLANDQNGLSKMDLFIKDGEIVAIQAITKSLKTSSNDSLYSGVTNILNQYIDRSELVNSGSFKMAFEQNIKDKAYEDVKSAQKKKLRKFRKFQDKKWFILELEDYVTRVHKTNKADRKSLFLKQLKKAKLLNEKLVYKGNGSYFNVDSIKNQLTQNEHLNKVITQAPVYSGCNSNDNNEGRKKCFQQKVLKHTASNFKFPETLRKKGIQGKTYTNFVIEKDGSISSLEILISAHELFDFESIRVVSEIPDCDQAAMQDGKPVRMSFTLPINAKLQ